MNKKIDLTVCNHIPSNNFYDLFRLFVRLSKANERQWDDTN